MSSIADWEIEKLRHLVSVLPDERWYAVPMHIAEGPTQLRVAEKPDWLMCELPGDDYAAFIAAARNIVPRLLDHVDRLESSVKCAVEEYLKEQQAHAETVEMAHAEIERLKAKP